MKPEPCPVPIPRTPTRRWSPEELAEIERHRREKGVTRCDPADGMVPTYKLKTGAWPGRPAAREGEAG